MTGGAFNRIAGGFTQIRVDAQGNNIAVEIQISAGEGEGPVDGYIVVELQVTTGLIHGEIIESFSECAANGLRAAAVECHCAIARQKSALVPPVPTDGKAHIPAHSQ